MIKFSNKSQENSQKILRKIKKNLQIFLVLFAHLWIIDKGENYRYLSIKILSINPITKPGFIVEEWSNAETMGCSLLRFWQISILSIYYQYLIQGIIHLESLYVNVKFCLSKKLASKVEIESLSRIEVKPGLLGKVMEWRVGGPGCNSHWGEYKFYFYFYFFSFKRCFYTILIILNPNFK